MALNLGDFFVKIGADLTSFKAGMNELSADMKAAKSEIDDLSREMAKATGAMGAAIVGFVSLSARSFADTGDQLSELSKRTGVSVEYLSRLAYVAQLAGTSLGGFEVGMRRLQSTITDAAGGMLDYQDAFSRLGLSYTELAQLTPEEQFSRVIYALGGVTDATTRAALAVDLLGRSGTQLLPIIADGSGKFEDMMKAADELGVTMDTETAAKASALKDATDSLKASVGGLTREIGEGMAPSIKSLADTITSIVSAANRWADANPVLAATITQTVTVMGLLMTALSAYVLIGPKVIAMARAIGLAMHSSLGPIGLVTLAISVLVGVLLYFANSAQQATEEARKLAKEGLEAIRESAESATAAAKKLNEEQSKALHAGEEELLASLDRQTEAAQAAYDDRIADLRAYYGTISNEAELFQKSLVTMTREEFQARIDALDKEQLAFNRLWLFKLQKSRDAYNERMAQISQELRAQLAAYQQQLDALDRVEGQETRARLESRKAEIYAALEVVETQERRQDLLNELAQVEQQLTQQTRAEQRQAIQEQMGNARDAAQTRQDEAQSTYDREVEIINQTVLQWVNGTDQVRAAILSAREADTAGMVNYYDTFNDYYEKQKDALAVALDQRLQDIARERLAKEDLEKNNLQSTIAGLDAQRQAFQDHLKETQEYYDDLLEKETAYQTARIKLSQLADAVLEGGGDAARIKYFQYLDSLSADLKNRLQPEVESTLRGFEEYWAKAAEPRWVDKAWNAIGNVISQGLGGLQSIASNIIGMQHGGRGVTREPTLFLAGEAGPERFAFGEAAAPSFAPPSTPILSSGGDMIVQFNGGVFAGTREDAERFADMLMPAIRRRQIGNTGKAVW